MPTNVEIKARAADFEKQRSIAASLAVSGPELIVQRDTFFHVPRGRLKLREFADGSGELIQYTRADQTAAKTSSYKRVETTAPELLRQALAAALGVRGEVRKRRWLYLAGQTRIHFDDVEELGRFIELEVVLRDGQSIAEGQQIATALMAKLGIVGTDLIDGAYIDLLPPRE
jgi:predicted adenylyl cyclase CyaB